MKQKIDRFVCLRENKFFTDNVKGQCAVCKHEVWHRPDPFILEAPKDKIICLECANKEMS